MDIFMTVGKQPLYVQSKLNNDQLRLVGRSYGLKARIRVK